jgi:antitoxin (DNA-binding transcriptional repressor) of toxin-antitoxin stability system
MQQVRLEEVSAQLVEATVRGDRIFIVRDDQQTVELVPVVSAKGARKASSTAGLIMIREDFDAPLPVEIEGEG